MNAESVFGLAVMFITSFIMIGIGIYQYRKKEPAGFYSGEIPPKPEELTDVKAWNHKHGLMWIIYGILIIFCSIIGCVLDDMVLSTLFYIAGVIGPLPIMIIYHNKMAKKYKKI